MTIKGRKKKPRCTDFDPSQLTCSTRGPISNDTIQHEQNTITLTLDELQTLIDKDRDHKTMEQGCHCMGVSKTVYAGIYASARQKVIQSLLSGSILYISCQE